MKRLILIFLFSSLLINISYSQTPYWIKYANGVSYSAVTNSTGSDIFIGFGGYSVKQVNNNKWVSELYNTKLNTMGIQHLFSIQGPDEVCYSNNEINLDMLIKFVVSISKNADSTFKIIVAAHSSGSYVAHEFFKKLYSEPVNDTTTMDRIYYFNLDGGVGGDDCGTELTKDIARCLAKVYPVFAFDSAAALYSPNYASMLRLKEELGEKAELIRLEVNTKCKSEWCVHQSLIIKNPYNPETFDLEKDYTLFDKDHPVQTDYLNVLFKNEENQEVTE